ncbi:MAG: hypothetical protein HYX68_01480 [Planctomycetes bacterium]|nr:hypothetical protein [Planctomycetota bacterium]
MKPLMVGWVCGVWWISAVCANGGGEAPIMKRTEADQAYPIPWSKLDERAKHLAKKILENPTVQARGPVDTFTCDPEQYYWLLDNPDRAVVAWRRLGAKCVSIERRAPGRFGYTDDAGSNLAWEAIHRGPGVRIWFADGKIKPSALLPLVPVKAMVILHHSEGKSADGTTVIKHHSQVVVHTDSKAAAAITKLMGNSAPRLAEQGLGQLQLFFSALSCYLERHPERVETLFRPVK